MGDLHLVDEVEGGDHGKADRVGGLEGQVDWIGIQPVAEEEHRSPFLRIARGGVRAAVPARVPARRARAIIGCVWEHARLAVMVFLLAGCESMLGARCLVAPGGWVKGTTLAQ